MGKLSAICKTAISATPDCSRRQFKLTVCQVVYRPASEPIGYCYWICPTLPSVIATRDGSRRLRYIKCTYEDRLRSRNGDVMRVVVVKNPTFGFSRRLVSRPGSKVMLSPRRLDASIEPH